MPLFTAEQIGALSDGATFGNTSPGTKGVDWPGETDDVDAAGYALTQGTATGVGSLTDLVTGGGSLTLTGSFSCPDVQEVPIVVPDGVTATIAFGVSGVDPGCQYSESGYAIEDQNGALLTDVTGDVTNSGTGYGVFNESGEVSDFSGTITNSGTGTGAYSYWVWDEFSGMITNTGAGTGMRNDHTGTFVFSGTCLDSGSGTAFVGYITEVTGIIGRPSSQTDLAAENIVAGKTILGVLGTWDYPQTTTLAVALRSAVGMAAANLDDQLDSLPTAAENATAVDSALTRTGFKLASDGLAQVTAWTVNLTGSLSGNVGGIAGTIQTLDGLAANLSLVHGSGSWEGGGGGAGTGAYTVTVTVTDGTDPLESAIVRATKGAETKVLLTNASGVAALPLDDGTWTLAITLAGYDGSTESLVVSDDAAITRPLSLQAITPPANDGVATGVLTVYDTEGVVESGVTVTVRIKTGPGTAGLGYDGADRTATSNGSGLVQFAGLIRGASYAARRGDGRWVEFTVPDEDSFNLPEIIGSA